MPRLLGAGALQAAREVGTICKFTFDLESGVRVTCDVGYFCANFSLPSLSVLDLGPDVRDIQIAEESDRQTSDAHPRLMPLP